MKRGKLFNVVIALVVVLGFTTSLLQAQAGRGKGRLRGFVLYADGGQPIVGAAVILEFKDEKGLRREEKTNEKGEFEFGGLGTGMFRVTAMFKGYGSKDKQVQVFQAQRNPPITLKLVKGVSTILDENASVIETGNKLYEEGKFEEALTSFKTFQEKTPEFYEVHINIGNCYLKMEKYQEAVNEFNSFLEKGTDAPPASKAQALSYIGQVYMKQNDMQKAQEYFMKSVELDPKDEILAYNVGEIFFGNNKYQEALRYFEIASKIKPKWGIPYLKIGYVHTNLGDMKKAVEYFSKFVEVDPDHAEAPAIQELIKSLKDM